MAGPRDIEVTFSAAGEETREAIGRHVRVIGADGYVYLGIDNDTPSLKRRVGMSVSNSVEFKRIRIKSDIAQTVRLTVSDVPQADDQQDVSVAATAELAPANQNTNVTEVTVPAGSSATLIAADADRQSVRLAIADTEPGAIYWAASGLTSSQGGWLGVGMVEYAPTEAEITAYNRGASDVVVSVVGLKRV